MTDISISRAENSFYFKIGFRDAEKDCIKSMGYLIEYESKEQETILLDYLEQQDIIFLLDFWIGLRYAMMKILKNH